jgi:hypothetical protein
VRFSTRPCPLFVWAATRQAAGGTSGVKSGRLRPRLGLVSQARADIDVQAWLVVLDEENIVAAAFDDRGTQVALAEHGVADEDRTLQGKDAEQVQGRLVLVGLGIDTDLRQHGAGVGVKGGDEMLAGGFAVLATAGGLAVERDDPFGAGRPTRGNPARKRGLEDFDVQGTKQLGERGDGGSFAASETKGMRQGGTSVAAELGDPAEAFDAGHHGEHGEGEHRGQGVANASGVTRVRNLGKRVDQSKRSRHGESLRALDETLPHLPFVPASANLNYQMALGMPVVLAEQRRQAFRHTPGLPSHWDPSCPGGGGAAGDSPRWQTGATPAAQSSLGPA